MEKIDFVEQQRFKVWWAWLGVISLNLLFIYAIIQQVMIGKPFGTKPTTNHVLLLIEAGLLLLFLFLLSIKLKTRITDEGIFYRFYPFQIKEQTIEWHELRDAYIRQYNSFHEYGGWGIRYGSPKVGQAVNTSASSRKGLQLQFINGRLLLLGTTRPDDLQLIIDSVMASGKINRGI